MSSNPNPNPRPTLPPEQVIPEEKEVYIYAEVDIDKAFHDILAKSKKIRTYLQERALTLEFTEKMRVYKNFVLSSLSSGSASIMRSKSSSIIRS